MWIKQLKIHDYRAFQKETVITFNKNLTIISGLNGVGKSTILAMISHVGQLGSEYKLLNGKPFRGNFPDIIKYDPNYDTSGEKAEFIFADLPSDCQKYNVAEKVQLRAYIQRDNRKKAEMNKRYRLIPKESEGRQNNKKIVWPSYYMGLSRLYPLGESRLKSKSNINEFQQEIIETHMHILNERLENVKFSNWDIGTKHPKATISSSKYGNNSNSNGQDNLGQIIEAVFSFKKLKRDYPDYIGGVLAIDELDASLHPAAQNRLIDWLLKMSQELDLQIVATTHSLSMIQHLCELGKLPSKKGNITVNYLIQKGDQINIQTNQRYYFYKNTLRETYAMDPVKKINVFTEDEVARWFIKSLIELPECEFDYEKNLNFLDVNISWSHLLNLLNSDYDTFSNCIFILDGDVRNDIKKYIKDKAPVNFNYNENEPGKSDILCLPGNHALEQELYEYVNNLPEDDKLFDDRFLVTNGIVNKSIIEKFTQEIIKDCPDTDNIKFYKKWFKHDGHQMYMKTFLQYWMKDNKPLMRKFINSLKAKTRQILSNNNYLY